MNDFFVFDTNTLVSAGILRKSVSNEALAKAVRSGKIVNSKACFDEFIEVILRKKFDKYFESTSERLEFIDEIEFRSIFFEPMDSITDCRDPKDNKFFELAVAANAACIITGDDDLLILNPFRNIPIVNSTTFLNLEF